MAIELFVPLGDTGEQSWVIGVLSSLNDSLNQNLQQDAASQAGNGYMVCLTDDCPWTQSGYDGNWIATSLMMSDFPWGGSLFNTGPSLGGGFWDQNFDTAVASALAAKSAIPRIPLDSWGAWGSALYGATYNAGMGLQLLYAEQYRIMPLANVDWLLANASAPMQWGESFSQGDWSNPPPTTRAGG